MMTGDITFYTFLQEMEMVEKPKKAPEQTAMVKMGMLGIFPIHHCHDYHHNYSLNPHHLHHHQQCHLEGVFMPCLLNIWGVMLFLR